MLFTRSKNIGPSRIYRISKLQNTCKLFTRSKNIGPSRIYRISKLQNTCKLFTRSKNIGPSRIYRISKLQNTYNYLAAARFTRDYLKILNVDTKNLSPPTVFEQEYWNSAVILFTSFLTTCFSRIFELGPEFQIMLTIVCFLSQSRELST